MTRAAIACVVLAISVTASAHSAPLAPGVADPPPPDPNAPPVPYAPPPSTPPAYYYPPPQPAPSPPRADHFAVSLGVLVGGGGNWLYGAFTGDVGVTLVRAPIGVRARALAVLTGGTVESDWEGDFSRFGAGVELRSCTRRGGGCLFADIDAGYQKLSLYDHGGSFVRADNGLFIGPRGGLEAGSALRFRIALEFYRAFSDRVQFDGSTVGSFSTVGLWFGAGYQL